MRNVRYALRVLRRGPGALFAITNQLTLPRGPGMRGMWQINGASDTDPASGRNYRANFTYPAYLALRTAAGGAADVFAITRSPDHAITRFPDLPITLSLPSSSPRRRRRR